MSIEEKALIGVQSQTLQLTNVTDALVVAEDVAKLIREKHLSAKIQGKEFVMVDGWQFAGTRFGIIPMPQDPKRLDRIDEIAYECSCDLVNVSNGVIVGHGYAICSNLEPSKVKFAEYAIASMAQTRSIGKAYRNLLSWLVKASGFEPTPYEEMDGVEIIDHDKESKTKPAIKESAVKETPTDEIDIFKDKIGGQGRYADKVWIEAPVIYLNSLRDPKYWANINEKKQRAILKTLEYLASKSESKPQDATVKADTLFKDDGELTKEPEPEKPATITQPVKSKEIEPLDMQLAEMVLLWQAPDIIKTIGGEPSISPDQDQKDFLTMLTASKLFTDTERMVIEKGLVTIWDYNTAILQTKIAVAQFKNRFKKTYKKDVSAVIKP